jgi:anti-anti-sigma factor
MRNWETIREDVGLTVLVQQDGDALVVSASGELNADNFKTLASELRIALAGDASEVTFDLDAVSFIASVGQRAVLLTVRQSLRNEGRLHLLRGSAPLERAISDSGIEHLLPSSA